VPDVLILEVSLPGISGLDVCQIVKRNTRLKKVKIVFLTWEGSPTIYKLGHAAGADIYMTKPVSPENLLRTLRLISPPPAA